MPSKLFWACWRVSSIRWRRRSCSHHRRPIPTARHPQHNTGDPAQYSEDDSIDDLDDLPDDDFSPASAARFGLYDAHQEADKW
ncbi:hypothetical protein [Streptomyces sp. NPDC046631]|jgi:hypothetical protein|uniref:hypothetical protein n=1 Tax=unclassified Streptomyces TaxID=2593676 RepID=UPI003405344F